MKHHPLAPEIQPNATPSHDEIAHCARLLWLDSECPVDRDEEIWLEAERRLFASRHKPNVSEYIAQSLCHQDHS